MGRLARFIRFFTESGKEKKNIFDESIADWKEGYFITSTGKETTTNNYKYSQEYFRVLPNETYTVFVNKETSSNVAVTVPFYDDNKNFIDRSVTVASTNKTGVVTGTFVTPENCAYIRISVPMPSSNVRVVGYI